MPDLYSFIPSCHSLNSFFLSFKMANSPMRPVFMEPVGIIRPVTPPPPAPPSTPVHTSIPALISPENSPSSPSTPPSCHVCKESVPSYYCGICKDCYNYLDELDRYDHRMSYPELWEDARSYDPEKDKEDYEYESTYNGCPDCGGYNDCYCE